jgi:hypothetical protein
MEIKIFIAYVMLLIGIVYLAIKYDYKSWPDIPGVNCAKLPE